MGQRFIRRPGSAWLRDGLAGLPGRNVFSGWPDRLGSEIGEALEVAVCFEE
jgi:hypothetical protein